jgi:hypothetical protein
MNNVTCKPSRIFKNKKKMEYLKDRINDLETRSKNKDIRNI